MQLLSREVAQLVERNLAKVEVASSRLVSRSKFFSSVTRVCGFFHFYAKKETAKNLSIPRRRPYSFRKLFLAS